MKKYQFISKNADMTVKAAGQLSKYLKVGDILCLFGDLGSGKTTFVKGLAGGLKVKSLDVSSPTFVLMNRYEGKLPLYHFDLYRIDDPRELMNIGYDEFFYSDGVAVVEWAEKLGGLLPKDYLEIRLKHKTPEERAIEYLPHGTHYQKLVQKLSSR